MVYVERSEVDSRSVERPDRHQGRAHGRRRAPRRRRGRRCRRRVQSRRPAARRRRRRRCARCPKSSKPSADRIEVLIDGGIRRGSDIVKALCLGARAVLIGRAYAYGLAAAGEAGVARAIDILATDRGSDAEAARLPVDRQPGRVLRRRTGGMASRSPPSVTRLRRGRSTRSAIFVTVDQFLVVPDVRSSFSMKLFGKP